MRIFSGIQPTGRKHLGNYIGAIAQYVSSQERGEGIFCIVDLHAITVAYDPLELRERLYDTTAILLAAGLDPQRCILFRQSDVAEHTELTWLLSSVTELGRLQRMHQFRDKSLAQRELVSAGLLLYPVLQAADVLAYRAEEVPVGEDQREHLELMRDVARRFNARFGAGEDVLVVPEHRIPEVGARIMDLQDPTSKMSTSAASVQGTVYVLDEPSAIEKKLKSAVTDSGSEVRRDPQKPGVSNLIEILAAVRGVEPGAIEAELANARYGELKAAVASAVIDYLAPVRERYERLREDESALESILEDGARRAQAIAAQTLADVRKCMGVGPPAAASADERRARHRRSLRCANAPCTHEPSERDAVSLATLELDLDVFSGPFDLLLTLVLREEVDLLELQLAEVVLAYLDHLEQRGELDLETATEFIVLVAALLELKSRLMLSGEEQELLDIEPEQAAEELLARMLDARRYRAAATHLGELLAGEHGVRFRTAPPPASLRRTIVHAQDGSQDAALLGAAIGRLLTMPPVISIRHIGAARVSVAERLAHLRQLLRRGSFSFDEAVRGADRMTVAVTLFALLELYKRGEVDWEQQESFGDIAVRGRARELPTPSLALAAGHGAPAGRAG